MMGMQVFEVCRNDHRFLLRFLFCRFLTSGCIIEIICKKMNKLEWTKPTQNDTM